MSDEDDKKKKKAKEVDKSTPHIADEALFEWLEKFFRGDERLTSIKVLRVWGKKEYDPTPVHEYTFPVTERPSKEDLVSVANDVYEAMQNDANVTRSSMMYEINPFNSKKGPGALISRRVRIDPVKVFSDGRGGGFADDESAFPTLQESSRKHAVEAWEDAQRYVDKAISTLGGLVHVQAEQLREKDRHIERLFELKMRMSEQVDVAENHALDREIIREKEKFNLELKRQGMSLLTGFLLPEAGKAAQTIWNHKSNVAQAKPLAASFQEEMSRRGYAVEPAKQTTEGGIIRGVEESLSEAENERVFGKWENDNLAVQGLLQEEQVRILACVVAGSLSPNALDMLVPDHGLYPISTKQGIDIMGAVGIERLTPLLKILKERQDRLNAGIPPAAPK